MHSSREARNAPPFEMPKPHETHHRALLWDTVYCDLSLTQSIPWLNLRTLFNTLHGIAFDPRDPPPAVRRRGSADVSPDVNRRSTRGKPKGIEFLINDVFNQVADTLIERIREPPNPQSRRPDDMDIDVSLDATNAVVPKGPTGMLSTLIIQSDLQTDYSTVRSKRPRSSKEIQPVHTAEQSPPSSSVPPAKKQKTGPIEQQEPSGQRSGRCHDHHQPSNMNTNAVTNTVKPVAKQEPKGRSLVSNRTAKPPVGRVEEPRVSADQDVPNKRNSRDLLTPAIIQEDTSGEDSDEWKPEDGSPIPDDEDDEMGADVSEKDEEEDEDEDEEDEEKDEEDEDEEDEDEEDDEDEDEEDEEEKEVKLEKKEKGQDSQGKENEEAMSETCFIPNSTNTNICGLVRDEVQVCPEERARYAHRILR